ncbi:hypothetical protein HMPREF3038_00276 [Akkermansia sp. KLE1797]|nr:hypothetical protein HMPREF3038_00276 [Akkermansia sp. KLE1797]KXU54974.1 hypothetical protein HMPREF3039_00855 [Akkermansia sp. KLE1798]
MGYPFYRNDALHGDGESFLLFSLNRGLTLKAGTGSRDFL